MSAELKGSKVGPIPTLGSLLHHHFFWLVLAVYLGGVVEKFFTHFTLDVVVPFMDAMFDFDSKAGAYVVQWKGVKFMFGDVIKQAFNLLVAITMTFLVIRILMALNR